ncbi:PH domain-containing protein [Pelomonas sp. Root1237]|uniref:PH domain-containing protein n=1 Tax=Pelomonas sp. Root1237 TaxID=1736434 RepID=UPI000AC2A1D9|nr:PH domain-containing protein [Pelomonas sp. Root1237]
MDSMNEEVQRELSPSEKPLWWGQPRQGVVVRGSDAFTIPFSLLWCGFAVFWEASALRAPNTPAFFVLWGIPFVLVGVYFVVGRFFVEARQRANTYYAVTSERVIIVSGVFARKVKSLSLRTLTDLSLSEARSGEGTITFGAQHPMAAMFGGMRGWPGAEQNLGPSFDLILNAKSVYETIRSAQSAVR